MEGTSGGTRKCSHCGGTNITGNVSVGLTAEADSVGLKYRTGFLVIGTEAFFADVCDDCGTIARIFVKTTGRKWYTK